MREVGSLRVVLALLAVVLVVLPAASVQPLWPDLSTTPPSEGGGRLDAALLVGIEDYSYVADVPGAVANVDDWYAWLKYTRELPLGSVVVLRDLDATRETILSEAAEAARRVGDGGTLWFVFVGHGAPSRDGRDGLLLGMDTQQTADSVYARGVSQTELLTSLEGGVQEQTLVVLDTCFSGRGFTGDALVSNLQPLVPRYEAPTSTGLILSAGQSNEFAGPLPGAARPAFSYLLLGALRGWGDLDSDGAVTADEAVRYARGALVELVRDRRQTPQLHGPEPSAVLSRGREQGPDLAAMVLGGASSGMAGGSAGGAVAIIDVVDLDIQARVAEAERLRRQREELERQEAELQRQEAALRREQQEERRRRLDAAETELRDAAESDWLALAPLMDGGGPEAQDVVQAYVHKYDTAGVTVEGETTRVEIVQVDEARRWLDRVADSVVPSAAGVGDSVTDRYGYSMVRLEPGEFWMGSPQGNEARAADENRHHVRLTQAFIIGQTEVTQELYEAVMGENPSRFNGERNPVEQVSWLDAVAMCNRLSENEDLQPAYQIFGDSVTWDRSASGYRLPTEAEWEYAARGDEEHVYSGSADIDHVGWYRSNSAGSTHEVGEKQANHYGLHDMTGNVWEWVWDRYGGYPSRTVTDPGGPDEGSGRVARGGSWNNVPRYARVATRDWYFSGYRHGRLGFRLARSIP